MTSTINASHTLDPDEIEVLGTAVPWGSRELRDLTHSELLQRFVTRFKLSYSDANPRASVLFGKLRGHAVSTVAPAPEAVRTVTLTDAEMEAIDPSHRPPISLSWLTAQNQKVHKMGFEDAQNAAAVTMRKLTARGPDPRIAAFNEKVKYFTDRGYDHTDAQNYAARQLADPEFNPDRTVANLGAPAQQAVSNDVAYLTGLLGPPGAPGYTAAIRAFGNQNTFLTLIAIFNGWIQDLSACRTLAQQVMEKIQIGGPLPVDRANAWAKQIVEQLVADSDRTPDRLSPGVVPPQLGAASVNRGGYPVAGPVTAGGLPTDQAALSEARRLRHIEMAQGSLARIHSAQGRR